jgi:23S rRNA (guanosine2251-2'-O)-methyltransferase
MDSRSSDILWGRNAVREALRGRRKVHRLWVASGAQGEAIVRELEDVATSGGRNTTLPLVSRVEEVELEELAGSLDHQGVAAGVSPYPYEDAAVILQEADLVLALDRVQDPQNLGAVVRTAEEARAAVVIPRHRAAEVTPAVVRASAGASEHARVSRVRNLADFLSDAKRTGFWVYGAEADATTTYTDPDYADKTILVVGSEGTGLGERVRKECDLLISIPLRGRMGSLNVSVAAGILLFEAVRQRDVREARGAGGPSPGGP